MVRRHSTAKGTANALSACTRARALSDKRSQRTGDPRDRMRITLRKSPHTCNMAQSLARAKAAFGLTKFAHCVPRADGQMQQTRLCGNGSASFCGPEFTNLKKIPPTKSNANL